MKTRVGPARIVNRCKTTRRSANLGRVIGRLAQWLLIFMGLLISALPAAPMTGIAHHDAKPLADLSNLLHQWRSG
ncbi:MAG: hypothetical protein WBD31_20845 [Rubripirellula sp.]